MGTFIHKQAEEPHDVDVGWINHGVGQGSTPHFDQNRSSHEIKENLIKGFQTWTFYVKLPVVLNNSTTISFIIVAAQFEHQMGFSMSLFRSDVAFAPI